MPKVNTKASSPAPVNSANKARQAAPAKPKKEAAVNGKTGGSSAQQATQPAKVTYPKILVNGVEIPESKLRITVKDAKKLLGWETETDCYNRLKEEDPSISPEACLFGSEFTLIDEEKKKITCWNDAHNRRYTDSWGRALAQDILRRKWRLNLETIIVSRTGQIHSGQHRLIGLVLAGQMWAGKNKHIWETFWKEEPYILSLVAFGGSDDQETISTLDNVKKRSLSDVFYTSALFSDLRNDQRNECSRMLEKGVDFLWDRTIPAHSELLDRHQTIATSIDFLDRHARIVDCVHHMLKCNEGRGITNRLRISPGLCAGMLYFMSSSDSDPDAYLESSPPNEKVLDWSVEAKARKFWEELSKDEAAFKPMRTVLDRLRDPETDKEASIVEKVCVLAKAWDAYVQDEPMTSDNLRLKYKRNPDGVAVLADDATFGGIDFGEVEKKKGSDGEDPNPKTSEEPKEEERKKKQQDMVAKIRKQNEERKAKKAGKK